MVITENISKYFETKKVLNNLTFSVKRGEILSIMGANGAGKSTLFNIIATLDNKFEGRLHINGADLRRERKQIRKTIGYVPGRFSLYNDLTAAENLTFFAKAYGSNNEEIIKRCEMIWQQLEPFKNKITRHLSGGMKQKLALCCALAHSPQLLLLDEPTTGIDPMSRYQLWEELKRLRDKGVTIMVSTHYLEEAAIADTVLFLHQGEQLIIGSPKQILNSYNKKLFVISGYPPQDLYRLMSELEDLEECYLKGGSVHLALPKHVKKNEILQYAKKQGFENIAIESILPDLEDLFIEILTNKKGDSIKTIKKEEIET